MSSRPRVQAIVPVEPGEGALGDLVMLRKGFKMAAQRFTALPRFTEDQLRRLAEAMVFVEFEGGQNIIVQGGKDDSFFVLKTGNCKVMVDGNNVGGIVPGGSFGEVALTLETPRTASIVAAEPCTAWQLRRADYQHEIERKAKEKQEEEEAEQRAATTGGWRSRRQVRPQPRFCTTALRPAAHPGHSHADTVGQRPQALPFSAGY